MKKRQLLITSLGNTLEWLDFGLFIFLAPLIGQKFFPIMDPLSNTLSALSIFAAGFICRPLGGILFGHAGDTKGRAKTLRISILIISLSTFLIGCLPSYQSIGLSASFLFVALRMIQGISIGGEYSGVMIYLAESASSLHRGFVTSFAAIGANLGFLLATLIILILNKLFSTQQLLDWGWRLPFLIIGCLGSIIFYLRFKLTETPTFSFLKTKHHIQPKPFITALQHAPLSLIKIFGLSCMGASLYYVFFGYMSTYLHIYHDMNENTALFIQSFFLSLMLLLVPLAGFLGDQLGRKSILIFTAVSTMLVAIPCFFLLQLNHIFTILIAFSIATCLSSLEQGNTLCAVVENCPANIRYSGIAFAFNLGNAIFGGTAPLVLTVLTAKAGYIAPAFYLMIMAMLTFIAATTLVTKVNINRYLQSNNS